MPAPDSARVRWWRPGRPVDVRGTLDPLRRGPGDPTHRVTPDGAVWRTARTPQGTGTLRIAGQASGDTVEA
ncbi:MAG: DNA-3-methyladenine glycosylase 2 family protein, partial [Actinomycetota bacterium]|nr:DNA-3-methyladenine glycosylase 2 family protein [Actinomycetota bacterium]